MEDKSKNKNSGMIWPYIIGISILLIFGASVATVIVANKLPVQNSDTYMMNYHEADAKANELIESRIAFDKKYKIEYISDALNTKSTIIKYKITTVDGKNVDNAKIKVVITRPNTHEFDMELQNPKIDNGVYTFESVSLPKEGRWNIMAKIDIGSDERYYNLKADTRQNRVFEY